MPTLQVRDLPEPLYRLLKERAQREHRSLAGQAIVELERTLIGSGTCRRREMLDRIREHLVTRGEIAVKRAPEELVREDRER